MDAFVIVKHLQRSCKHSFESVLSMHGRDSLRQCDYVTTGNPCWKVCFRGEGTIWLALSLTCPLATRFFMNSFFFFFIVFIRDL